MANRKFEKVQALEKEIKHLYAELTIGASGAVTLTRGTGIASVVKESAAGTYTLTLQDKYTRLMWAGVTVQSASAEDLVVHLVSETVASTKTVQIRCTAVATAANPASGDKLFVKLELKNSSVL
jgi:hypothetical protein